MQRASVARRAMGDGAKAAHSACPVFAFKSSMADDVPLPLPVPPERAVLPVDLVSTTIRRCVQDNDVVLVSGPTGCGKSTRVPTLCSELLGGAVLCTMPRRLAAVSAAARTASELGVKLGTEVGCWIGAERLFSPATKITFATAGVLVGASDLPERWRSCLRAKPRCS